MQVQIIFTIGGSSSVFGNFAAGDTLRCSAEHARHFVEEARCARYADKPEAVPAVEAAAAPAKPASARKASKGDK